MIFTDFCKNKSVGLDFDEKKNMEKGNMPDRCKHRMRINRMDSENLCYANKNFEIDQMMLTNLFLVPCSDRCEHFTT